MSTLVAGIDECGYGSILGPLVVASSIFLIKEDPEMNMWNRLQDSIGHVKRGLGNRILVCDSKKAFNQKSGLGHLERTIKAFLIQLHLSTTSFSSILPTVDLIRQIGKYPWYESLYDDFIPVIDPTVSSMLMKNMKQEGIEFVDFRSICTDVVEFNKLVKSTGNKASVVTTSVLKLIQQHIIPLATFCCAKKIVIYVDRLGGRKYYWDMLSTLSGFRVHQRDEFSAVSKYKLFSIGKVKGSIDIQFEVKSDDKYLPVALASMVGKYIREKVMQHMNEYFIKLQPGLKPTAGYWTDGWRFLGDLEDKTLDKAGLERVDLVRIK